MKEELIRKYMDGTATHEEERLLRGLLLQDASLLTPQERALRAMLQLEPTRMEVREEWMQEDESALFDRMVRPQRHYAGVWRWTVVAAAMVGVAWLVAAVWRPARSEMAVTYIYGNKVESAPLAMEMMQQTMDELLDRPAVEEEMGRLLDR